MLTSAISFADWFADGEWTAENSLSSSRWNTEDDHQISKYSFLVLPCICVFD